MISHCPIGETNGLCINSDKSPRYHQIETNPGLVSNIQSSSTRGCMPFNAYCRSVLASRQWCTVVRYVRINVDEMAQITHWHEQALRSQSSPLLAASVLRA